MRPTWSKSSTKALSPASRDLIDLAHLLARQAAREIIVSDLGLVRITPEGTASESRQVAVDTSDEQKGTIR